MSASLVGSEMCIRDRNLPARPTSRVGTGVGELDWNSIGGTLELPQARTNASKRAHIRTRRQRVRRIRRTRGRHRRAQSPRP
eukprot:10265013-Alexandrium_andersonii.AAC.1